ncbi:hypothetical protein V8C44DRAFT_118179 [Trichoderma aethiopicum]
MRTYTGRINWSLKTIYEKKKTKMAGITFLALFTLACPLHSRAKTHNHQRYIKKTLRCFGIHWNLSLLVYVLIYCTFWQCFFWYLEGLCIYTAICCLLPFLRREYHCFHSMAVSFELKKGGRLHAAQEMDEYPDCFLEHELLGEFGDSILIVK